MIISFISSKDSDEIRTMRTKNNNIEIMMGNEHASKIINYEKQKEMIPLTDAENKSYKEQKVCYICKKRFSTDDDKKSIITSEIIDTTKENRKELLIVSVI